jgi:hypothetical protein
VSSINLYYNLAHEIVMQRLSGDQQFYFVGIADNWQTRYWCHIVVPQQLKGSAFNDQMGSFD